MEPVVLTNDNFEQEVVKAGQKVLVDFWAPWCGPCKMLSPLVDEIAKDAEGFKVCKVNVDEEQELAERFGIVSIPTLLVFDGDQIAAKNVGFVPKEKILEMVK